MQYASVRADARSDTGDASHLASDGARHRGTRHLSSVSSPKTTAVVGRHKSTRPSPAKLPSALPSLALTADSWRAKPKCGTLSITSSRERSAPPLHGRQHGDNIRIRGYPRLPREAAAEISRPYSQQGRGRYAAMNPHRPTSPLRRSAGRNRANACLRRQAFFLLHGTRQTRM
jgi:hypothetical protein